MSQPLCHLDGRLLPVAEARIDPLDRGFLFGDAVYEVVKVLRGSALFLAAHLERLAGGLEALDIARPARLAERCRELLAARPVDSGSLYLQVTRGVAPRTHLPPREMEPTVLILAEPHPFDPPAGRPRRLLSRDDPRGRDAWIKSTSRAATVLGKLAARDAGVDEVLWVGPGGALREGGSSSFFVRQDDRLLTHPLEGSLLPGITRRLLLERAAALGLAVSERSPLLAERQRWQEAFVCGTLTGVQPVAELDGEPLAPASPPGEWTARLARELAALEEREVARSDGAG